MYKNRYKADTTATKIEHIGHNLRDTINEKAFRHLTHLVGISFKVSKGNIGASHSAPVGERTRWGWGKDMKSFPGWRGRIWLRFFRAPKNNIGSPSDFFNHTLTHAGSGGGGDYNSPWSTISNIWWHRFKSTEAPDYVHCLAGDSYLHCPNLWGWTFHFYDQDWPEFARAMEKRKLLATIKGDYNKRHELVYHWECPSQAHHDSQFRWEQLSQQAERKADIRY
jgi:hypothetical protein